MTTSTSITTTQLVPRPPVSRAVSGTSLLTAAILLRQPARPAIATTQRLTRVTVNPYQPIFSINNLCAKVTRMDRIRFRQSQLNRILFAINGPWCVVTVYSREKNSSLIFLLIYSYIYAVLHGLIIVVVVIIIIIVIVVVIISMVLPHLWSWLSSAPCCAPLSLARQG